MAYSSKNCMISEKEAKKIRIKEIITKERREKMEHIFAQYLAQYQKAKKGKLRANKPLLFFSQI